MPDLRDIFDLHVRFFSLEKVLGTENYLDCIYSRITVLFTQNQELIVNLFSFSVTFLMEELWRKVYQNVAYTQTVSAFYLIVLE